MDSAKGWAGVMRYSPAVWEQLKAFYERDDTFSLGVCNGCQLMAMLARPALNWRTPTILFLGFFFRYIVSFVERNQHVFA